MNDAPAPARASKPVTRRTLVKAAAWTAPAIALAAPVPAYAASPCTPETSIDDLRPGSRPSSITFFPSMVTATLAFTSSGQGGDPTPGDTGLVEATSTTPSWNYIEMEMLATLNAGDYVQLTITMSEPVTGLSFVLHDIDSERDGYVDTVEVISPMAGNYTFALGSNIQGDGTAGNRFRPINWGDTPISSGQGDLRITVPGVTTTVTIRYRAGLSGRSSNQHIGLGDLRYEACVLPSPQQSRQARSFAPVDRPLAPLSSGTPQFVPEDASQDS
ncbi:hypothetical protein [Agromyces marinus]|uniref:Uncharacterized protein n=1 Tax=Agromyces marinus TaxID=1389020 RepID=A0ABM8H0F2_9MICO|nr:hypothetical protein [Agromyces marinus]UIP57603.1 hypothetical protein DSM26151_04680 [Agromyces marinus]BDZ54247.1 hypothetical protein GCM10025870_13200 [Agromyces marinus]